MTAPTSGAVAAAVAEDWRVLAGAHPNGWFHIQPGAFAAVSGNQLPPLNTVGAIGSGPQPETVGALLDEVAATGLAHSLQVRPGAATALGELARERGMVRGDSTALMVLDDPAVLDDPPPVAESPAELTIRRLEPAEARTAAGVMAAGFGLPEEPFAQMMAPQLLGCEGLRCYVGEVDGEPVVTALGLRVGEHVGVFHIATVPTARRRRYGAAMTARAIADGREAGAAWAYLQSGAGGRPLFERLGFRSLEDWDIWIAIP